MYCRATYKLPLWINCIGGIAWATEESVADTIQESEEANDAFESPVAEEDEVADPHTVITRVYRTETYTATAGTGKNCFDITPAKVSNLSI